MPSKLKLRNNQTVQNVYMWMQQEYDLSEGDIFTFPTVDIILLGTLDWHRSGLGDACQSGKMATTAEFIFVPVQNFASA